MSEQTNAQRLDELRELVDGKRPALSFQAIDGLRLVLRELDAANQTIARQTKVIDAVRNWRYELGDVGRIASAYPATYRLATTFDVFEDGDSE